MADRRLQVFHAVAKSLSFTKAAERLFMTQPAVTSQIRQLEDHFGARLFDRSHGGISLTQAGVVALDYAERILALNTELETRLKEIGGRVAGTLGIGASTTIAEFLLPRIIGEFKTRYPEVLPRVFVGNTEGVQSRIEDRTLDLGFIEGDSHTPTLVSEVCCEDELRVVCSPAHALAAQASVTARALREFPYISRETGSGTRQVTDRYFQKSGVAADTLNTVVELGSPEAIKGLAATGLGFAIMSRAAVRKEIELGQLVQIPLSPRLVRYLSVVYAKERFHSQMVTTFIAFAKVRLQALAGDAPR
jgi:DNA-binding transcriptional LysR family regulator